MAQQRALEELDAKDRKANLVITGLPEGDVHDASLIEAAMTNIDATVADFDHKRIGKATTGRVRPILMSLRDPNRRPDILKARKALKNTGVRVIYAQSKARTSIGERCT